MVKGNNDDKGTIMKHITIKRHQREIKQEELIREADKADRNYEPDHANRLREAAKQFDWRPGIDE